MRSTEQRSPCTAVCARGQRFCSSNCNVAPVDYCSSSQVGDWGRGGQFNQSAVAAAMARTAADMRADFVISTGELEGTKVSLSQ